MMFLVQWWLIAPPGRSITLTAPPLICTQAHFDEAEAVIRKSLDQTLNDVAGEIAA